MRGDAHSDAHAFRRASLSERDQQIIELVGRLRQVEARHVAVALFAGHASGTPLDRALKRLVTGHYLARMARSVGGDGGGSGQYVYQLGRAGWRLLGRSGEYWAFRSVSAHTLGIADCFAALRQMEHDGDASLLDFTPEPACHRRIGGIQLTPDAYTEVGFRQVGVKVTAWLEIDRATEHGEVIQKKCIRYWHAYERWSAGTFPYVVFVVPDEQRQRQIERVISGGPDEALALFKVCVLTSFPQVICKLAQQR